jgi:hypothetical protein
MADQAFTKLDDKKPSTLLNLLHIALDTYDDIFSDFDPSGYEHRILSDDFIKEMQKRYVETRKGDFEIHFSIPAIMRSQRIEALVKKRLKDYFQDQIRILDVEVEKRRNGGIVYFVLGFVLLLAIFYGESMYPTSNSAKVLATLITPLGWFGMWEGLDMYVRAPSKHEETIRFYSKFSKANYVFINEEDFLKELSDAENAEVGKSDKRI